MSASITVRVPITIRQRGGRRLVVAPAASAGMDTTESPPIEPAQGVPEDVRRAIDGTATLDDRKQLTRPRIILSTRLTRDSPDFQVAEERTRALG